MSRSAPASTVVVAGAPFEGDGLVPDDVDPLDVAGAPEGVEESVGEPQAHDVLDGLLAEKVVHAEHGSLRKGSAQQPVEFPSGRQIRSEGLLHHDPGSASEPGGGQRSEAGTEHGGRQGQVGDHRPRGSGTGRPQRLRFGDVAADVPEAADEAGAGGRAHAAGVDVEAA
jgi:hypothetical protein